MTQLERLRDLLTEGEIWRMGALVDAGVAAATVRRAVTAGHIEQVSRGVYRRLGAPHVAGTHLAEALVRVPRGLICLHSAAQAHGLDDESAARIWVALPHGCHPPRVEWPPMRFVSWRDPAAFEVGVEEKVVSGVPVRTTGPARTVVDMLRMSSTVGEDRALECLRDYLDGHGPVGELQAIAADLGVGRRLAPVFRVASALARAA